MFVVVILFWMFTYENPEHKVDSGIKLKDQLVLLKDPRIWKYMQYYSLVFGGFVGLSLWMTNDLTTAALLATIFILPSDVIRALGGWVYDRFGPYKVTWWVMWISWVCLFIMSYPQTAFTIKTITGETTINIGLNVWMFTSLLFVVGIAWNCWFGRRYGRIFLAYYVWRTD